MGTISTVRIGSVLAQGQMIACTWIDPRLMAGVKDGSHVYFGELIRPWVQK